MPVSGMGLMKETSTGGLVITDKSIKLADELENRVEKLNIRASGLEGLTWGI